MRVKNAVMIRAKNTLNFQSKEHLKKQKDDLVHIKQEEAKEQSKKQDKI